MSRPVLLDTNVLIYALDKESQFHFWATRFFEDDNFTCFTSSKNLAEFLCVLTRGPSPALQVNEAINAIKVFLTHCRVLYPDHKSLKIMCDLILEHEVRGLLVHDYEIASIAIANGIPHMASVNRADFKKIPFLRLISPDIQTTS